MAMLTYTGRVVLPEITAPSPLDIAVALSRMTRFGGHTKRWWSVLDHTLFCEELMHRRTEDVLPRLAVLLHDAHEAVTSDVPTDAKGPGLKILQNDLDRAIMGRYFPGGYPAYEGWKPSVREIDLLALVAEAHVVGPPVSQERLEAVEPRFVATWGSGAPSAIAQLQGLLDRRTTNARGVSLPELYGRPPFEQGQENHPAVKEFLSRLNTLM